MTPSGRRRPPDDLPLTVRRVATARRMRLAVDPRDGTVRLTLPTRTALAAGLGWVAQQRAWIDATRAALSPARPFAPGGVIPLAGREVTIDWRADHPRAVRLADDMLRVGGPVDRVAARIERWLRAEAARVLAAETADYAAIAGVTIGRVSIGDPGGRWGSCSANGDIRYSWRLILMPPEVRRATVAHEVAHRLHMDHSPAFHAAAARLFGREPTAERAWLKRHGRAMHRVGRDA